MTTMNKAIIKVSDLYLKAYLETRGFTTEDIQVDSINGKKTIHWVYIANEQVEEAIEEFREDEFLKSYITEYLRSKREITEALRK